MAIEKKFERKPLAGAIASWTHMCIPDVHGMFNPDSLAEHISRPENDHIYAQLFDAYTRVYARGGPIDPAFAQKIKNLLKSSLRKK